MGVIYGAERAEYQRYRIKQQEGFFSENNITAAMSQSAKTGLDFTDSLQHSVAANLDDNDEIMIAASEPQEYVPGGRQQTSRHPGPIKHRVNYDVFSADDNLRRNFARVAISNPTNKTETWLTRKIPYYTLHNPSSCTEADSNRNDEDFDDTALGAHLSRISQPSRRTSSILASGKRFSGDSYQKRNDSKTSLNIYKSASAPKEPFFFRDDDDKLFDAEEELYVYDGTVTWTRKTPPGNSKANTGRITTIRSFTTDCLVKQALWCTFYRELPLFTEDTADVLHQDENKPVGDPIECVAILDHVSLRTYTIKGEDFISVLPMQVQKMWASKFGILLQRLMKDEKQRPQQSVVPSTPTNISKPSDLSTSHSTNTTLPSPPTRPTLYHLGHPLDNVTPLAISNAGSIQVLDDRCQQLVYVNNPHNLGLSQPAANFCMMYDEQTQQHSVYRLRRVRRREVVELSGSGDEDDGGTSCYTGVGSSMSTSNVKNKNRLSSLIDGYKITTPPGLSPFSSKTTSRSSMSREPSRANSITTAPSRMGTPLAPTGTSNSPWLLKSSRLHTPLRNPAISSVCNLDSVYLLESQPQEMEAPFQLTPKLCLDYLWTESNHYAQDNVRSCAASKVFLVDDMVGQWYLCYYILTKRLLCTVKVDLSNPNNMIFGATNRIQCKDAIAIHDLHMIAVLELTENIVLYSGLCLVATLHMGGVLAQHTRLLSPTKLPKRGKTIKFPVQSPYPKRSSLLPHCGTPTSELRIDLISPVLPDNINRQPNMQSGFSHSSGGDGDASTAFAAQTPHYRATRFANTPKRPPVLQITPTPTPTGVSATPSLSNRATSTKLVELREAVNTRLTLQYSDEKYYSVRLQKICVSRLVRDVVTAIRSALPTTSALTTLANWYATRNALGSNIKNSVDEWRMFSDLLFELLGYIEDTSDDSLVFEFDLSKRQKLEDHGSDSDFAYVLNSIQHSRAALALNKVLHFHVPSKSLPHFTFKTNLEPTKLHSINAKAVLFPYIRIVHFTLHLLYEDLKLNTYRKSEVPLLAAFLSKISADLNLNEYQSYYFRDCAHVCPIITHSTPTISESELKAIILWPEFTTTQPVSVVSYLNELLNHLGGTATFPAPYPFMDHVNNRSREIILLCGSYICGAQYENHAMPILNLITTVTSNGVKTNRKNSWSNFKDDMKQSVTERIILLMTHMRFTERSMDSYPLSIRFILFDALWRCRENPPKDWPEQAYRLLQRFDLASQAKIVSLHTASLKRRLPATDFAPDTRAISRNVITEADTPLSSPTHSCHQCTSATSSTSPQTSDQVLSSQFVDDGLGDVSSTNNPVLRLRFRSDQRVSDVRKWLQSAAPVAVVVPQRPDVTDHDYIEERERHLFAITARTMALPVGRGMFSLRTYSPIITEPLSCPPLNLSGRAPPHGATIELTHIDVPTNMNVWPLFHNGVANGLRISALVRNLDTNWIVFNKPRASRGPEWTLEHAGLLLALGLNGHLKNLNVLNTMDYLAKVHEMTSMGMLLGLSVAHRGTCSTQITKMLSVHCEALLPPTSMELDIQQHLQVAALIGIGFVYQGTSHRQMTEVLLNEIGRPPGPEMENSVDRESYGLSAGLALGLVALRQGSKSCGLADLNVPETLHYYMVGGNKRPLVGAQKDKYKVPSFQIKEGTYVNLDITAPGATLALGLMYLGTNNKAIADWMDPPSTQFLLDFVRPDFLMLRILARALIMWDDIRPNSAWVKSQVPESILPFCMVTPMDTVDIDYEAMNQAYCNIVAGACFAIGLRYAGTADTDAHSTLLEFCHMFISLTTKSLAELAGKPTIETCLNTVLLADAMVMAGTGNLQIMRIIRHLRKRVSVSSCAIVTYGSHLAVHMALGLLFLGGGRYTLSNSPMSVAALICALYPKFPTHSNDNRYHLQAFRHLYVLAAEPRLIIPKDITKQWLCYANIEVTFLDGTTIDICGPDMIPDLDTLYRIAVDDPRYWPVVFEKGRNWEQLKIILSSSGILDVKQRAGCLGYVEDSFGFRTDMARSLTEAAVPWQPTPSAILAFSSDILIRQYVTAFLLEDKVTAQLVESGEEKLLGKRWTRILYECVTKNKLAVLPLFSSMLKIVNDLPHTPYAMELKHFQLISSFVQKFSLACVIADVETIKSIEQEISEIFEAWRPDLEPLLKSYAQGEFSCTNTVNIQRLAAYVTFLVLPYKVDYVCDDPLEFLSDLGGAELNVLSVNKILELLL